MYVAVKGGERAIEQSYLALARMRRGDTAVPELSVAQIREQMPLAVHHRRDLLLETGGHVSAASGLIRAYGRLFVVAELVEVAL